MGKRVVTYTIDTPFPDDVTPRVLKAMHDDGLSLRALADKYGVSRETIRLQIKKTNNFTEQKVE